MRDSFAARPSMITQAFAAFVASASMVDIEHAPLRRWRPRRRANDASAAKYTVSSKYLFNRRRADISLLCELLALPPRHLMI